MSSLWKKSPAGAWQSFDIVNGEPQDDLRLGGQGVEFVAYRGDARLEVAVLASTRVDVRVNGEPLLGGLGVLTHRDEIRVGDEALFYSSHSLPQVTTYHHTEQPGRMRRCGVCRGEVCDGDAVVVCAGCGRIYHMIDASADRKEKHCWTYRPQCLCGHPTSLSGDTLWRPDREESDEC